MNEYTVRDGKIMKNVNLLHDEPDIALSKKLVHENLNLVRNLNAIASNRNHPKRIMPRVSEKEAEKACDAFYKAVDRHLRRTEKFKGCVLASEMHFYRTLGYAF